MTNTTAGRPIDPRFDPAFQPGYDPNSDPSRAARVPSYDAAVDSPRLQPGRVVEPPRSPYSAAPASPSSLAPAAPYAPASPRTADAALPIAPGVAPAGVAAAIDADVSLDPAVSLRRNPFLILLWVLGVLFIGLGVFTAQQVLDPSTDLMAAALSGDTFNYFSVQLFTFGAPLLVALGLGTMALAVFLHALRWRSRR